MGTFIGSGIPGPTGATGATGPVATVTGTAPVVSTGGANPVLSISAATPSAAGSMSSTDKSKLDALPTNPVTAINANAPITSTGGATPTLGITAATSGAAGSMSAADKARLDGMPNPPAATVFVFSEADLPAPVANVVTLAQNTTYQLMGGITITAGRRLVLPVNSCILGTLPDVTYLSGNVNDALVTVIGGTADHGYVYFIGITNSYSATTAGALRVNDAGAEFSVVFSHITGNGFALDVELADHIFVFDAHLSALQLNGKVVIARGAVDFISIDASHLESSGANTRGVSIDTGAVINHLSVERSTFVFDAVTQVGIAYSAGTVSVATLSELTRQGSAAPMNSGWDQGTSGWRVLAVDTLPDSTAIGASYVSAPGFTVPLGVISAFSTLAPTAGTPWSLTAASERFSLNSNVSGSIKYTGKSSRRFLILASASLSKTGVTVSSKLAVFVNGVELTSSESIADVTTRAAQRATAPTIAVLNTNDVLDVRVANLDNTDSVVVAGASISALAAIVS